MKRTLRLLGLSGVALGATWYVATRRREELRSFVTHRLDPLVLRFGLAGGEVSRWATVEHVGRISGTTYHTPVYPTILGDHVYVLLPLGTDSQWARNIQAAGHCRMQFHETLMELDEPAIVQAGDNPAIPRWLAGALERVGRPYLRLHILDRVPGEFTRDLSTPAPAADDEHRIEIIHPAEKEAEAPVGV